MARDNIDERFRKPRRTKGTPFHSQRNFLTLGVCLVSGLTWVLFELLPQTKILKKSIAAGKFEDPPAVKERILHIQAYTGSPELQAVLRKIRQKQEEEADGEQPQAEDSRQMPCGTKISKYFTKPPVETDSSAETGQAGPCTAVKDKCDESPYKNSLKQINCKLNDSVSDEKEFMSPIVINKRRAQRNPPVPKPAKNKPSQRTKRAKKTGQKTIEDAFHNLDVNPDHLQMAMALSESTHQAENPESQGDSSKERGAFTAETRLKNAALRSTLERFGFRYGVQNRTSTLVYHEAPKKRKKSKFAYITPILLLRTEEDREAMITSKVSLILSEVCRKQNISRPNDNVDIGSEMLQKYKCETRKFFQLATMDLSNVSDPDLFYTASLHLPTARSKCGCLLKSWRDIPGRDLSPTRSHPRPQTEEDTTPIIANTNQSPEINTVHEKDGGNSYKQPPSSTERPNVEPHVRCSISPDLFCDDENDLHQSLEGDESVKLPPCLGERDSFGKYSLEEFEDDNNGICHFESFHEDEIKLSQGKIKQLSQIQDMRSHSNSRKQTAINTSDFCDLTVSSDEEDDTANVAVPTTANTVEIGIQEHIFNRSEPNIELRESELRLSVQGIADEVINEREIVEEEPEQDANSHKESSLLIDSLLVSDTEMDNTEDANYDQIMNEDTIILENTFSNIQSPDQGSCENAHEVEPNHNRFSVGFDFNFSNESSLNVTRYINSILNKSLDISKESSMKKLNTVQYNDSTDSTINRKDNEQSNSSPKPLDQERDKFVPYPSPKHLDQETDEFVPSSSQASSQEVQHISDEELNYSSNVEFLSKPKSKAKKRLDYLDDRLAGNVAATHAEDVIVLSDDSSDSDRNKQDELKERNSKDGLLNDSVDDVLGTLDMTLIESHISDSVKPCTATPTKSSSYTQDANRATPKNTLIIKTDNVTPMPCYDNMDTPKVVRELDKFGVRPLKRQRGVQLLKYIYESTHPVVGPQEGGDSSEEDTEHRKCKKRKEAGDGSTEREDGCSLGVTSDNCTKSIDNVEIVGDIVSPRENVCNLIFERRQSAKIASCRIPLDIVWHNFISSNTQIRENMLIYEPLQLEVLHSMLKDVGFKFHIQDLLTFLDRKCITVRVATSQGRAKRK